MTYRARGIVRSVLVLLGTTVILATSFGGGLTTLMSPTVVPRTAAGALALTLLFGYRLVMLIRSRDRTPAAGRFIEAVPMIVIVPLVLVPAALQHSTSDFSGYRLFSGAVGVSRQISDGPWGGSGVRPTVSPDATAGTDEQRESNGASVAKEAEASTWVESANPALLAAVGPPSGTIFPLSGPITIQESDFSRAVDALWDDPERFVGREVTMTAFVHRDEDWPDGVFAAARMAIWCCAADAQLIGVIAVSPPDQIPPVGTWLRVTGTLSIRERFETSSLSMARVPQISNIEMVPVAPPATEYVPAAF